MSHKGKKFKLLIKYGAKVIIKVNSFVWRFNIYKFNHDWPRLVEKKKKSPFLKDIVLQVQIFDTI